MVLGASTARIERALDVARTFAGCACRCILHRRARVDWFGDRVETLSAARLAFVTCTRSRDLHHGPNAGLVLPALLSTLAAGVGDWRRLVRWITATNPTGAIFLGVLRGGGSLLRRLDHDGSAMLSDVRQVLVGPKVWRDIY